MSERASGRASGPFLYASISASFGSHRAPAEIVVNHGDSTFEVTAKDDDQNDNANVSFEIVQVWKKESIGRREGEEDQCDSDTGRFRIKDR